MTDSERTIVKTEILHPMEMQESVINYDPLYQHMDNTSDPLVSSSNYMEQIYLQSDIKEDPDVADENTRNIHTTPYEATELKRFLEQSSKGKEILHSYRANNNRLTKSIRSLLTRVLIQNELDQAMKNVPVGQQLESFTITKDRFIQLSSEVEKLFPGESRFTYFTQSKAINNVRLQTSGTLWEHYNYKKSKLRNDQFLTKKRLQIAKTQTVPVSDEEILESEDIVWLHEKSEPYKDAQIHWKQSFANRRHLLVKGYFNVREYLDYFPCLRELHGKDLLLIDFEHIYTGKSSLLKNRWSIIKSVIIKQLELVNIKDTEDKALTLLIPTLSPEYQDPLVLYLLPLLIQSHRFGKRKRDDKDESNQTKNKSSIDIRRKAFFLHVKESTNLNDAIEQFKQEFDQNEQSLQPIPIFVGPYVKMESFYVLWNGIQYQVASCVDAIDLTFKIISVLNQSYPDPALTLWMFIQKCGFSIDIFGEKINNSLNVLIGCFKQAYMNSTRL